MSVESLIFLAIFVLLPLIERLIEASRQGKRRPPVPPQQPQPPAQRVPQPRPAERRRAEPQPPRHRAEGPGTAVPPRPVPSPQDPLATGPMPMPEAGRRPVPEVPRYPSPAPVPRERMPSPGDRAAQKQRQPRPVPTRRPRPAPSPVQTAPPKPAVHPPDPRSLESLEGDLTRRRDRGPIEAPPPVRRTHRPTAAAVRRIVRNPTSLRRAVLAAAIIGPCRALDDNGPSAKPSF